MGKSKASGNRLRQIVATLGRNQRGAALLEFTIVVVPFIAIIVAILQITLTMLSQQVLETAAEKATRQLLTGEAQKTGMTQTQFKNLVCSKLPSFMPCTQVMVDVRTVTSFAAANLAMPTITYDADGNPNNSWQFSPGAPGQITITRIMYFSSVITGPLGFDISNMSGKRRLLSATAVFQIEPYT